MDKHTPATQNAYFAGGCFWHIEETFRCMKGVTSTKVGYMGGSLERPTYKQVCSDTTGHAETVKVTFNPDQISYQQLLMKFFEIHDPTSKNKQGPDVGTQYRSIVFFKTPEQEQIVKDFVKELSISGKYIKPIVTEILPYSKFWIAEEYHQNYLAKNKMMSCIV